MFYPLVIACMQMTSEGECLLKGGIAGFGRETLEQCYETQEAGEQYARRGGAVPLDFTCVHIPEGEPL